MKETIFKLSSDQISAASVAYDARLAADLQNPVFREAYEAKRAQLDLAAQLAAMRRKARLTQQDLASRLGTRQSAIAQIENGRGVRIDTILRYAAACGLSSPRLSISGTRL
jgi:DNA-binding XRE family transcriptional regulator